MHAPLYINSQNQSPFSRSRKLSLDNSQFRKVQQKKKLLIKSKCKNSPTSTGGLLSTELCGATNHKDVSSAGPHSESRIGLSLLSGYVHLDNTSSLVFVIRCCINTILYCQCKPSDVCNFFPTYYIPKGLLPMQV